MNAYTLTYFFDNKKPLKTALLVFALGADIVNLAFLIAAIGGDYLKFAYLVAGIVIMLVLRLSTLKLTYNVKYVFKDDFSVYVEYPHKTKLVLRLNDDFIISACPKNGDETSLRNARKLYIYEQDTPVYVIEKDGERYALALDDYMLALILSRYGKTL